ncbi:molybdopterin-synthase adenylyltransferase MoeB [Alkalisalibacterium limincola]|uniref:Molybdopterin-synthase adenylyltransferase n=1 Tax=Alkalisalibacterium limincola TaxID=2699169 RepID=A0A5C8KQ27_9GAMM|nr:molybdopterin-synthase adenylyltransferase MoeB [Alkalisalibacterium limincola]TXK62389.1 molybdopterin-synthase adenylyltransferase MoeB [Alkalisalibacterium limincola]
MDIPEITPAQALERVRAGAVLVDVREDGERAGGMAEGALGVARAALEAQPVQWLPDRDAEVLLLCAAGRRSMLAAQALAAQGYSRLASVAGGTSRWREEGLPMSAPTEGPDFLERYSRHLLLPEVGLEGQRRLARARVLMVGAGGLGSPIALYLAAAGVGHIRLVDDDVVDRSNLQRQVLHREAGIGRPKVASGAEAMSALNPNVTVEPVRARLSAANVEDLLRGHDLVIDGSDNFATRYLVNDACVNLGLPMVYGAVHRFEGQASVFWPAQPGGGGCCYRCLFPEPPPPEFAPNCSEAGVIGVLPGVVGLLQATEAVKLILGVGQSLSGRLLQFDALRMRFDELRLVRDPDCPACGERPRLKGYEDLPAGCALG